MVIKYFKHVKNKEILDSVLDLLILCDKEFVPPLSSRTSTTQSVLVTEKSQQNIPHEYFENIKKQHMLVAFEGKKVVGFMSFIKNYVCQEIPPSMEPNVYITTVIVHPQYRNHGITNGFYNALIEKFVGYNIFTRTWSTNRSHTRILSFHKFYEHCRKENDRGENIDTVYYHHPPLRRTKWQIITQYRLVGNFVFLFMLLALTISFLVIWFSTDGGLLHELSIAFSTSLIASALCLLSDVILKYRESKNDEYINTLKSFGIENLQFHKDELLESIIPKCSNEIWISGYRLIMTAKASFREALCDACRNSPDIKIRVLTVAPWSETFKLVYGDEDVSDNYFKVFYDLCDCVKKYGVKLEIKMTKKPIFNDTYKADDRFITGPYLHCMDSHNSKITAKDFFSLDINDPNKELYNIIYKDYNTVWNEAEYILDVNTLHYSCLEENISQFSKDEKFLLLKRCCKKNNTI